MAKTTKDKLAELMKKEAELKAQIQAIKARESEEERKRDTRRKILIGGVVLSKVKRGEWNQEKLQALLNNELKADRDRELFGLPLLASNERCWPPMRPSKTPALRMAATSRNAVFIDLHRGES